VKRKCKNSLTPSKDQIMGIEEGEEKQAAGMHNIFNKIIVENFPNLEKTAYSGTGCLQVIIRDYFESLYYN
jgi:hypothetical protein